MKCYPHNYYYRYDELEILPKLLIASKASTEVLRSVMAEAETIQSNLTDEHYLTHIMKSYDMSAPEGMALMTLCESLLRTPDKETQDKLIKDKLSNAEWYKLSNNSFYSKAASVALTQAQMLSAYEGIVGRLGWPAVREMTKAMVKQMGTLFVMGSNIETAIKNKKKGYAYSFDMLGEAATDRKSVV